MFLARLIISSSSPSFLAISSAFEQPIAPITSLYVGDNVSTLNSIDAHTTPFVTSANSFKSLKCDVTNDFAPKDKTRSEMLTASAAPSPGSVPAPNSSNKTNDLFVILSRISIMFLMCPENVERLCSMLCSSPISEYTPSKIAMSADFAGIYIPLIANRTDSPTNFKVTVLPPVFGPVIRSILSLLSSDNDTGTTLSLSMRGCLPLLILITPLVLTLGFTAFNSLARLAFAKMQSISVMTSYAHLSLSAQP